MIIWWVIGEWDKPIIEYELVWTSESLPEEFILNDWVVSNQSLNKKYHYACVFFWESNIINEIYKIKMIPKKVSWEHIADYAIEKWWLDINAWALLSDWPKASFNLWLIDWYAQVNTIEDIKKALVNEWAVWVGSNKINWIETNKWDFVVVPWSWYWHKFSIVWYNKKWFICENSYWMDFNKWRFTLLYKDFWLLYNTKIVDIINNNNFKLLNKYLKLSKELKYKEYSEHNNKLSWDEKMIANIAGQIRYIGKVNNKKEFWILFK